MANPHPHALVVPSRGQGHVNGTMQLAQSLAMLGFKVTFLFFSSSDAKLKAQNPLDRGYAEGAGDRHLKSAENVGGSIQIREIEDGLAPGDIHGDLSGTPVMKENLFNLILDLREQGTPPICLISDCFLPWTHHVAERAGIPRVEFWTSNAMSCLLLHSGPLLVSQGIFPEKGSPTQWKRETPLMVDQIPGLPPFSSEIFPKEIRFGDASSPPIAFCSAISSCTKHAERILIHTMSELEPDAFRAFQALGIPAYAIGPLFHNPKKHEGSTASSQAKEDLNPVGSVLQLNEEIDYIPWLNKQVESSVIYVAFGSAAAFSAEEIQELAHGLEASGNPFLWVVREDSYGGAELSQVLPDGFLERISGKGMIISWASQVEVLAHKAVGGFLTHCGWNSTFESLWAGVPMLACPLFAEQRSNAHYICKVWGVGLELGRTETGGVERRYVEEGVRRLMQEEEGQRAKGKAQGMMKLAKETCQQGGQSYSNLQKFYEDMKMLSSNALPK